MLYHLLMYSSFFNSLFWSFWSFHLHYIVHTIISNVCYYLRAGGHYLVYTRASNIYLTTRGKDPFAYHPRRKEFTPIEAVMLEPIDREYAMAVGGFRMPEE
nr:PREDICTED: mediator of RNA polymerase II transcription subunit 36a-like [Daucus carota subsp. sativus]